MKPSLPASPSCELQRANKFNIPTVEEFPPLQTVLSRANPVNVSLPGTQEVSGSTSELVIGSATYSVRCKIVKEVDLL